MKSELEFLKEKLDEIQKRIAELEPPVVAEDEGRQIYSFTYNGPVVIEFDGGTSCNIPRLGFGKGYGSYQIASNPIERVEFGNGHSCNSAEIRTILSALKHLSRFLEPSETDVVIRGDSQIALHWCNPKGNRRPSKKASRPFVEAADELRMVAKKFKSIKTEWRSRDESVRIFGH